MGHTKVLAWHNYYANQRNNVILITSPCNYAMMEMIGILCNQITTSIEVSMGIILSLFFLKWDTLTNCMNFHRPANVWSPGKYAVQTERKKK